MRRLLSVLTAVIAIAACGSSKSAATRSLETAAAKSAIEQIEVKWHQASSTKNVDLMMTLWAPNATFTIGGKTYAGTDEIRNFFAHSAAPFMPEKNWVSDTPAYKERVTQSGDKGTLYFECHYVDVTTRQVAAVVSADNDVALINGHWMITKAVGATPVLAP
jgi:ketosteroid isomerase-like protein